MDLFKVKACMEYFSVQLKLWYSYLMMSKLMEVSKPRLMQITPGTDVRAVEWKLFRTIEHLGQSPYDAGSIGSKSSLGGGRGRPPTRPPRRDRSLRLPGPDGGPSLLEVRLPRPDEGPLAGGGGIGLSVGGRGGGSEDGGGGGGVSREDGDIEPSESWKDTS
jgi:hypothetical protein